MMTCTYLGLLVAIYSDAYFVISYKDLLPYKYYVLGSCTAE